jgi:hypothetical protein
VAAKAGAILAAIADAEAIAAARSKRTDPRTETVR